MMIPSGASVVKQESVAHVSAVLSQKSTGNWILLSTATSDGIVGVSGRIKLVLSHIWNCG